MQHQKFKIHQLVWFIEDNKVRSGNITGVYYSVDSEVSKNNRYVYSVDRLMNVPTSGNWITEKRLFKNKKALVNSLY